MVLNPALKAFAKPFVEFLNPALEILIAISVKLERVAKGSRAILVPKIYPSKRCPPNPSNL